MPVDFRMLNQQMPEQIAGSFNEGRRNRLSMLAAERQGRMQEMQMGQEERQMADQETLRNMYQESGGDVNVLHQNLMKRGMRKEAQSLQEHMLQQQTRARQQQEEAAKATAMQQYRGQLKPEEQIAFDVAPGEVIKNRLRPSTPDVSAQRLELDRQKFEYEKIKPAAAQGAKLSPTAQKELFEADDTAQSSKNVQSILQAALALNDKTYSGYGAKARAVARSNLPGESLEADNTIQLDNMMTGQALESLKATFGGMPTEGERKILLEMQASADKTPAQRKDIMQRAIAAAKKREQFSLERARALRSGTYFGDQPTDVDAGEDKTWSDL